MRRQTHKEYMEILQKTDPITFYEMGGEDEKSNFGCLTLIVTILVVVVFTLFLIFFGGK